MADSPVQGGVIRWEDPPPPTAGRSQRVARPWAIVAAQLRSRPGVYGLIDENLVNPSLVGRIKQGESWWSPPGAFDAVTRIINGRVHVWACYLGDPDAMSDEKGP